jgi:hypothetical protein
MSSIVTVEEPIHFLVTNMVKKYHDLYQNIENGTILIFCNALMGILTSPVIYKGVLENVFLQKR